MRSYRRPLAPQEIDYELVCLIVSSGTFLGLALWFSLRLPTPQCAFHSFTGLPCLTCGATRSAYHFLHGHWVASFFLNPLSFLAICALVAFDLYALAVVLMRARRFRPGSFSATEKLLARSLVIAILAANWLYLLIARPI